MRCIYALMFRQRYNSLFQAAAVTFTQKRVTRSMLKTQ